MSVIVVIPAYQAERHVRRVVERVLSADLRDLSRIVIVNDGSRDGTRRAIEALEPGACPLDHIERAQNGGYGAAMKDGLERARQHDPEIVACVHADGQYGPELLPKLCAELRARRLDVLQGSRIASGTALDGGMPRYKFVANAVLNRLENLTLGLDMSDYHSGYLLYGARALARLPFRRFSDSFDFDLEVIASARAHGLKVAEAPVPTHYGDEVSHLNPITYGFRVLRVLMNYQLGKYDPK
jgi:glycosyltransferase involved in cell wall biosynthesis